MDLLGTKVPWIPKLPCKEADENLPLTTALQSALKHPIRGVQIVYTYTISLYLKAPFGAFRYRE